MRFSGQSQDIRHIPYLMPPRAAGELNTLGALAAREGTVQPHEHVCVSLRRERWVRTMLVLRFQQRRKCRV